MFYGESIFSNLTLVQSTPFPTGEKAANKKKAPISSLRKVVLS